MFGGYLEHLMQAFTPKGKTLKLLKWTFGSMPHPSKQVIKKEIIT